MSVIVNKAKAVKTSLERVVLGENSLTVGEAVGLIIAAIVLVVGYKNKLPMKFAIPIALIVMAVFITLF